MTAWHKSTADLLASPPWQGRPDPLPCQARDVDPDIFFADLDASETARAIALCAACPIAAACYAWALETGQKFGTWGGRSLHPSRLAS